MTEEEFRVSMTSKAEPLGFSLYDLLHAPPTWVVSLRRGSLVHSYTIGRLDEDHATLIAHELTQAPTTAG